jgi:glycine/D-amino acid oxidase-like deaminating enzyme
MSGLGHRYWKERTAANRRRAYPRFHGEHTADAVVIGGGLTGSATAFALVRAGADVVLIDAEGLADAGTASGLGIIVPQPDSTFQAADRLAGRRASRTAWTLADKSAEDFASTLDSVGAHCDLEPASLYIDARSPDEATLLKREQVARRDARLAAPLVNAQAARSALATDSYGALRLTHAYRFDPVRAALALSSAAADGGARVFEHSVVSRTRFTRKYADVHTAKGRIRTKLVVVATGEPGTLFGQLRRHTRRSTGYVVVTQALPAAVRRQAGAATDVITEIGESAHWLRWIGGDRAMFAGALAKPAGTRLASKALVQRTGQLMYELSIRYPAISGLRAEWSWDVPVVTTPDGLPWIGTHRNYPFHFFAMALGWHGDALAWRAARAAVRAFKGEANREEAILGFERYL